MPATVQGVHLGPGDHASRPAANAAGQPIGALYSCTDHSLIYKTDGSSWSTYATLGTGSGISGTLFDAKGDLIGASAADTPARLAASATNDLILAAASGETTGLQWQARSKFKYTMAIGTGDISFSSTSKAAIDATDLPYQTHTLAVGDVVRCVFGGQLILSGTQGGGIDFEVDQPTSANVFIAAAAEYGLAEFGNAANRRMFNVTGLFVATEAGSHGFRPAAIVGSGTCTFCNATSGQSDTALTFSTEKLGPVTA